MKTTDASIRGRRALMAWIYATVLLFGLFVIVRVGVTRGMDEHLDAAQERAVGHAAVIGRGVEFRPGSTEPNFNRRELTTLIQAEVFDDPTVARVRVYDTSGVLLFATDQDVRPGSLQAPSEDPGVTSAASGTPYRSIVETGFTWSTVGVPGSTEELLQTFEPLKDVDRIDPVGVVGVDFFMDELRADAVSEVDGPLTVIAILALVCLTGAVVTYRRVPKGAAAPDDEATEILVHDEPESVLESHPASEATEDLDAELAAMTSSSGVTSTNGLTSINGSGPEADAQDAQETEPPPSEAPASEQLPVLQELVAAAEELAARAEDQLARPGPDSAEAMDLRARLAKTAARKKLAPSSNDDA